MDRRQQSSEFNWEQTLLSNCKSKNKHRQLPLGCNYSQWWWLLLIIAMVSLPRKEWRFTPNRAVAIAWKLRYFFFVFPDESYTQLMRKLTPRLSPSRSKPSWETTEVFICGSRSRRSCSRVHICSRSLRCSWTIHTHSQGSQHVRTMSRWRTLFHNSTHLRLQAKGKPLRTI